MCSLEINVKIGLVSLKLTKKEVKHLILNQDVHKQAIRLEVFYKKGVLRNFAKFTGKHLYQSLFFNKVAGLSPMYVAFS